jgi:SAM-dependent methyltransferase
MQAEQSRSDSGRIAYARNGEADKMFRARIRRLLDGDARRICDVGGGAKPIVPLAQIEERGLDYVVLDESGEQLEKAPAGYRRVQASILDRPAVAALVRDGGAFDAVISRWTAEHIPDGRGFHESVFELLRPGGTVVHLFPTLYSIPFLVNRALTPALSSAVLFRACSEREAKFRPYYSWCRGPSARQLERLSALGYTVESYTGFFGHSFYAPIKPLHLAHRWAVERLLAHPLPSMTSFALVVLQRPA